MKDLKKCIISAIAGAAVGCICFWLVGLGLFMISGKILSGGIRIPIGIIIILAMVVLAIASVVIGRNEFGKDGIVAVGMVTFAIAFFTWIPWFSNLAYELNMFDGMLGTEYDIEEYEEITIENDRFTGNSEVTTESSYENESTYPAELEERIIEAE